MATFVNGAYVHSADANTSRAANMNHTDCINVPAANSTKAMPYNPRLKPMQYVDDFSCIHDAYHQPADGELQNYPSNGIHSEEQSTRQQI